MSTSLDSIWDEPIVEVTPDPTKPALFLPGSDEETSDNEQPPTTVDMAAVDDIFAANMPDEDEEFAPLGDVPDVEKLRQREEERLRREQPIPQRSPPRDALSKENEKDKDGPKPKRKLAKLDDERLIDSTGFPQLIRDTRHFKPKGKGHEVEDLNRLIGVYQFWTHRMYPKTKFRDTVQRIEQLCHSRRMQNNLSMWRDKAHGKEAPVVDLTEDGDDSASDQEAETTAATAAPPSSSPVSPSTRAPTVPPSSASEFGDDDDIDIDAFIREDEERRQREAALLAQPSGGAMVIDNDEEDMWNLVQELEETTTTTKQPAPTKGLSEQDDWEDLYA